MLVQFRNGQMGMVINNVVSLTKEGKYYGYVTLNDHKGYEYAIDSGWDIIQVSNVQTNKFLANPTYWNKHQLKNNLLWKEGPEPIKIELNSEYTAEVGPEKVTVGCQTFSIDKLEELLQAARSLK